MAEIRKTRPIVRQFKEAYAREAAQHVRAGGHAIVWEKGGRARFVFPIPDDGDSSCLHYWALLDIGRSRWRTMKSGPYRGLAFILVPRDSHAIMRRRAERDSVWPGTTRKVAFDCLACGVCCTDNFVELDDDDIALFQRAGRSELLKPPYAKMKNGKVVLRLLKNKRCRHLQDDNCCAIYPIRPSACWMFPVASECCLSARETANMHDGAPPS